MLVQGIVRAGKGITLFISNEYIDEIIRIAKLLKNSSIWIDGVSEPAKYKRKNQEDRFLGMLLGTLGASLLGNMLTGKGIMRADKGIIRAGARSNTDHLGQNL